MLFYYLLIYSCFNIVPYYVLYLVEYVLCKKVKKITKNSIFYNYIKDNLEEDIWITLNASIKKDSVFMTTEFPLIILFPVLGQTLLVKFAQEVLNLNKNISNDNLENMCNDFFIEALIENSLTTSTLCSDLELIEKYSSKKEKLFIIDFLKSKNYFYYNLGFQNFQTLMNLVKSKNNQITNTKNSKAKKEISDKLKLLINDYILFIQELDENIVNDLDDGNIEKYDELLKSMTIDIKNKKY